jgi:hypothetical protein
VPDASLSLSPGFGGGVVSRSEGSPKAPTGRLKSWVLAEVVEAKELLACAYSRRGAEHRLHPKTTKSRRVPVPSGYECPRVPLLKKKMCFGDSAPNNQANARRSSASTATSGVGMQSREEALTKGELSEDQTLTSSIVLTREDSLTKRQPGSGVGCTARPRAAVVRRCRPDLSSRSVWRV